VCVIFILPSRTHAPSPHACSRHAATVRFQFLAVFFLFRLETLFSPPDSRSAWGNRRGGSHETLAATTSPSHRISHTTACSASFRLRSGRPVDATSAVTEKNGAAGAVATDRSRPTAASGALARRSSLEIGCHGGR